MNKGFIDKTFWFYAVPSGIGYLAILILIAIVHNPAVVVAVVSVIGLLSSIFFALRGQHRDRLALNDAQGKSRDRAVEKLLLVPWLFMADGIRQQESLSDWECKIREQRKDTLGKILDESYR